MADKNQPDEFGITDPGQAAAGMPVEPPKLTSPAEVQALAPGTEFIDPTGKKRIKPYDLKGLEQAKWAEALRQVPDGAPFIDPQGNLRDKPEYEPLDFGDQILVDMSRGNERQIEAILRGQYGDANVKREPITGDFYVERDGKKLKPGKGGFWRRNAATAASDVAPIAGFTGGSIIGGVGGSVVPGPGTLAGGVVGAGLGGAAGEAFNQSILALAGYSSSVPEYLQTVGKEALTSAAGQAGGHVVGKALSGGVNALGKGVSSLGGTLGRFLGATPELADQAARVAAGGGKPRPSQWLLEAPALAKDVEVFDPAFRKKAGGVDVLEQSAGAYYDEQAPALMEKMGIPRPPGRLTQAEAPVALEPFGANMIAKATARQTAADARLNAAIEAARQAAMSPTIDPAARQATQAALRAAQAEATAAAQGVIDNGFKSIQADVDNSIKLVNAGENPGDMTRLWAEKFTTLRQAVAARAKQLYDVVTTAAGDVRPDVEPIAAAADDFLAQVPKEFEDRYPALVRQMRKLRPPKAAPGDQAAELAALVGEGEGNAKWEPPTYGQLAQLRSMLRQDIDFNDLTPGVRQGSLKHFVGQINEVLFDKGAPPELQEAAAALRTADDFYSANIKKFKSESAKWAVQQLEAGVPVDPKGIAKTFLQPDRTEEIRMLREAGGPQVWRGVQAADTQAMLDAAKTLVPGEVDGLAFAKQVLDRHQNGILTAAYDKDSAAALLKQAQRVMLLEGKIPMSSMPGDTVQTLMRRAAAIGEEIEREASADPIKMLKREMDKFTKAERIVRKDARAERLKNPLNFLTQDTSAGAIKSAEKILNSPDNIIAVARQFGEQSPEFEMLRQVWATRLFQRGVGETGKLAGEFATKITPEVQSLMFPGTTLEEAQQLAKDMAFLMPPGVSDAGGSMAAASRILHPITGLHLPGISGGLSLLGLNTAARAARGWYYKTVSDTLTSPAFTKWIAKGLRGSEAEREVAKRAWRAKYFPMAGRAIGAGFGAIDGAEPDEKPAAQIPLTRQAVKPWQEIYREKYGRL